MSWRVAAVSGGLAQAGSWRVAKVSGSLAVGTWRVAEVSGALSRTSSAWRVANVSGQLTGGAWRIAKVSGQLAPPAAPPVLAPIPTQTVDPVQPVTLTAQITNGIVPDSYSFTSPGITFTVSGNTGTFISPGSPNGGTVTVTVTATKGSNTATQTATVLVNDALGGYLAADGTIHAVSYPYKA